MAADRPLRNLGRETLLDIYISLQSEPVTKRYNLRKELQTDRRDNNVFANRWVTHEQYLEMITDEIRDRGLDLPASAGTEDEATAAASRDVAGDEVAGSDAADETPQQPAAASAPTVAGQ